MATFHEFAFSDSFPTVTVSEIRPSSVLCVFPIARVLDVARRRGNHGEGYSSYVPGGAYKLRQFTEPISRHVTSTVQKLIKGQPRTGLNRHRRGYAIKEAASGVHFQDVGSYWARPV